MTVLRNWAETGGSQAAREQRIDREVCSGTVNENEIVKRIETESPSTADHGLGHAGDVPALHREIVAEKWRCLRQRIVIVGSERSLIDAAVRTRVSAGRDEVIHAVAVVTETSLMTGTGTGNGTADGATSHASVDAVIGRGRQEKLVA